jgi:Na+/H+-dicarboxylate symporter
MEKRVGKRRYIEQVLLAVLLGSFAGWILGPRAAFLGELGSLLIRFLKTLATPLVFFAIVDAFCKTQIQGKSAFRLLGLSLTNASVASGIALLISVFLPLRLQEGLTSWERLGGGGPSSLEKINGNVHFDFRHMLQTMVPSSLIEPFSKNEVITVVFLAVFVGIALRRMKSQKQWIGEVEVLEKAVSGGLQVISLILHGVVQLIPIAIFGVLAQLVGQNGWSIFSALGAFVFRVALGMGIHCLIYYPLLLWGVGRISPIQFFKNASEALATAFGTGSSLATLPVTLKTLQEKMKVSAESSRLAACVGTNFNHDGILLYEALTALMLAQLYGVSLGVSGKLVLLGISALAALGIAGVPDAGLITLSLVLSTVGLPLTLVPVLMSVDWFIGRLRATTNVTSDLVVANLLERLKK